MATRILFGSKPVIEKTPLNYTKTANPLIISIDPRLGPLGYPELSYFYREPDVFDDEDYGDDSGFDDDVTIFSVRSATTDTDEDVPSALKIDNATAKFHKSKDGRQLVDVKLTFEEVDGADGYEVSISGPGKKGNDD
jgi:hypothetical protein